MNVLEQKGPMFMPAWNGAKNLKDVEGSLITLQKSEILQIRDHAI